MVRLAVRSLSRSRGYSFVAIASLALAIAVTTAAAAVVNAYLVRALPYAGADRIYHVMYAPPGPWEPAGLENLDWNSLGDVVEHAIASTSDTLYVTNGGYADSSRGLRVSRGFLDGLGVRAEVGRVLGAADYQSGADPAHVMISQRLWRERFGSDAAVIGREFTAEVDSRNRASSYFQVVGILPEGFWFGTDSRDLVDVIIPQTARARTYRVRLKEGVPASLAAERITAALRAIATDLPANWAGVTLQSARDRYVSAVRPVLRTATLASAVLLAIACMNLGGLTLLRSLRRQKEIGVRLALGASRGRIVRMLIVEACVLVSIATAAGLALAGSALAVLGPAVAAQLGRPAPGGPDALRIDMPVVAFVSLLGLIVALSLPMLSLLTPWGERIAAALRRDGRTTTESRGTRRWRSAFVVAQIAGALALLVGSGLMMQSLAHMMRAEYGIAVDRLTRVSVDYAGRTGVDAATLAALYERTAQQLAPISRRPVAFFQWPQFSETPKQPVDIDDAARGAMSMGVVPVTASYFDVLGIRLVAGRLIADADRAGSEPVAVVSATAAHRLWPDGRAIGRQVRVADRYISGDRDTRWHTVVGVVSDVRQTFDDRDEADIYVPFLQAPPDRYAWLYITRDEPPAIWGPALRSAVATIDRRANVRIAVPLIEEASRQWTAPRFLTGTITGFAMFSLLFAVLGIYGVTAFSLQQRQRELAIRSALGATRRVLITMVLRECGLMLVIGLGLGVVASLAVGRALAGQMFGVGWLDAPTLIVAVCVLAAAAFLTAWRPAVRAVRASPVEALTGD